MLAPLIAYDAGGNITSTIDVLVARDPSGKAIGLYDFEEAERQGIKLRQFWEVPNAVGSGTWPEWLDAERIREFRVELDHSQPLRIRRLVHPSGHVRHRDRIEAEIQRRHQAEVRKLGARTVEVQPVTVDLRDLLGGPGRPLKLDHRGKTVDGQRDSEWIALPLHVTGSR